MPVLPPAPSVNPPDQADPLLNRVINDRYKVIEQIGQGGMGRVYKAMQKPLDRVVALKVLGGGHDRDPNFYKRFALEASVTAKLTHPNSITLYDYGRTDDGIFFIAMEYLNGRTLSQVMQADGPLAQERVIHIAQQICRSLREAHSLRIIHRDLKPANVMLLRQQDDHDFVKVLDFGLVKFFVGEVPDNDITNAGTFMGSPHYIAPEQARNQNPDQRCDIYSLGVLLYHMLTGKVPFTAPAPVDIILKHLHDEPPPMRTACPGLEIAPELEEIVHRCMQKRREDRFQGMDELLVSLKAARTRITGVPTPGSVPPYSADAPSGSMRTPSQPMPLIRTPAGGHHASKPPPPPPDALEDVSGRGAPRSSPRAQAAAPRSAPPPPSFSRLVDERRTFFRPVVLLPAAVAAAAAVGIAFYMHGAAQSRAHAEAAIAAATEAPITTDISEKAPEPLPAAVAAATPVPQPVVPTTYQTVNTGTTLVSILSVPSGSQVRDADDRLLGTTPFDVRLPTARPVVFSVQHDGFKPVTLRQTPAGEKMPISVTLKKDSKSDSREPNKRSVGYKEDPY